MTDPSPSPSSPPPQSPSPPPEATAERIAAEGGPDIRERIRALFVETVRNRRIDMDRMGETAESIVQGAVKGVKDLMPNEQDSVLRDVVDGLADGVTATAHATRLALKEARGRGETFAREELDRAVEDLKTIERMFVDTIVRVVKSGTKVAGEQIQDLGRHVERTATKVRPSIESAVAEAMKHPVKTAGEAAQTGLKAAPKAAGMLLQAMGGLLQGAGELLAGRDSNEGKNP